MKKVFVASIVFGAIALSSCKKDYECKYNSPHIKDKIHNDLKKSEAEDAEDACVASGGSWSKR